MPRSFVFPPDDPTPAEGTIPTRAVIDSAAVQAEIRRRTAERPVVNLDHLEQAAYWRGLRLGWWLALVAVLLGFGAVFTAHHVWGWP